MRTKIPEKRKKKYIFMCSFFKKKTKMVTKSEDLAMPPLEPIHVTKARLLNFVSKPTIQFFKAPLKKEFNKCKPAFLQLMQKYKKKDPAPFRFMTSQQSYVKKEAQTANVPTTKRKHEDENDFLLATKKSYQNDKQTAQNTIASQQKVAKSEIQTLQQSVKKEPQNAIPKTTQLHEKEKDEPLFGTKRKYEATEKKNSEKQLSVEIELSVTQKDIFERVKCGENVFFTGAGGTGKSYLLNCIRSFYAKRPNVYVTAMTGIAATNVNGTTLHSFAGIGLGEDTVDELTSKIFHKKVKLQQWRSAELLIIDEVSMLSADLFEKIEAIARVVRQDHNFFGGLQVVFVGDFFQLPPVSKDNTKKERMLFESVVWQKANITQIELKNIYRQKNDEMQNALTDLRHGNFTQRAEQFIKDVCRPIGEKDGILPTRLYARNTNVDAENNARLNALQSDAKVFFASCGGEKSVLEEFARNCLAVDKLCLKIGAQVIHLVNKPDINLMNGSRGTVVGFDADGLPLVLFASQSTPIIVPPFTWEKTFHERVIAHKRQIPLRLAWAITIHKSQGMSIDRLQIALADCFEYGQAYVALSRATSKEGLELLSFDKNVVQANPKVIAYSTKITQQ